MQEDTRTENGMKTNSSSLNNSLDLFFKIGASRAAEHQDIIRYFSSAFAESPLEALKILFWGRDVRGGAGERRFFRICLNYLAEHNPQALVKNIHLIAPNGATALIANGYIDLLIGGSPCQDLSIAKKNRQGLDGARSGLFWEYVRILKEAKPKYFVLRPHLNRQKPPQPVTPHQIPPPLHGLDTPPARRALMRADCPQGL
jgi:hypothetical protein